MKFYQEKDLQPIYDDEELKAMFELYMQASKENDPYKKAIEDDLDEMTLQKLGCRYNDIYMEGLMGEDGKFLTELLKKRILDKTQETSIDAILEPFDTKSLKMIAAEFNVRLPKTQTRKVLIREIKKQLFSKEAIIERLTLLEDHEMALFRETLGKPYGRFPRNDKEMEAADELIQQMLAFTLSDDRLYVPAYIENIYNDVWSEELDLKRQKINWMYKCLNIAAEFYGVMTWDVLSNLFTRKFKRVYMQEISELFYSTPDYYRLFIEHDGRLMLEGYEEDDYYKFLERDVQMDKPFYIPSRREIEEFWDKGCLLSSPSHQAMYRFFVNEIGCSREVAEIEVQEIYNSINREERLQELVDRMQEDPLLGDNEFVFSSKKEAEKFVNLYMEMQNHSHIMANRGYPPHDLFLAMGAFHANDGS